MIRNIDEMKLRNILKKITPVMSKSSGNNLEESVITQEHPEQSDLMNKDFEKLSEEDFQSMMANSSDSNSIAVEVVYATNVHQTILEVQLSHGANIEDGIVLSGLLEQCEDIDLTANKVGIHGVIKPLTELLSDGDRVEVYRQVIAKI